MMKMGSLWGIGMTRPEKRTCVTCGQSIVIRGYWKKHPEQAETCPKCGDWFPGFEPRKDENRCIWCGKESKAIARSKGKKVCADCLV